MNSLINIFKNEENDTEHTLEMIEEKSASCTEDGNIEYWYCQICGKYFADEEAKEEIALSDTILPATGH